MESANPKTPRCLTSPSVEEARPEPAHWPRRNTGKVRGTRTAVALGVSTVLIGLSAGFAAASTPDSALEQSAASPAPRMEHATASNQDAYLFRDDSHSFATWFFGRTVICFKNMGSQVASYEWISATTFSSRSLGAYEEYCDSRSFVGFGIWVHNNSSTDSLIKVSFPYGP